MPQEPYNVNEGAQELTVQSSSSPADVRFFIIKCWRENWSTSDDGQDLKNH